MTRFSPRAKSRLALVWVTLAIVAALLVGVIAYQFIRPLP
jgi:hypothetical protein